MIFNSNSKYIGITAPASDFNKKGFLEGIEYLKNRGFIPIFNKDIFKNSKNYLKGSDQYRKNSFEELLNDSRIKFIFMARGGYGSVRTLNSLDKKLLVKSKKILIGFSDITTFHIFMNNNNIATIHAPMVNAFTRDLESTEKLFSLLNGEKKEYYLEVLRAGTNNIESILVGGNLAVILSLVGTKYQLNLKDKILFVEDINEPLYKIDRMLMQLKLSSDKPKAIILGQFTDCGNIKEIETLFLNMFDNIPIYSKLDIGHFNKTDSIILGINYKIVDNILKLK